MIDAVDYVKIIMKKRNMRQADLIRAMEAKGIPMYRTHMSEALNGRMSCLMARKIEIALDLPKYSLVKMTGVKLTEAVIKQLEKIG